MNSINNPNFLKKVSNMQKRSVTLATVPSWMKDEEYGNIGVPKKPIIKESILEKTKQLVDSQHRNKEDTPVTMDWSELPKVAEVEKTDLKSSTSGSNSASTKMIRESSFSRYLDTFWTSFNRRKIKYPPSSRQKPKKHLKKETPTSSPMPNLSNSCNNIIATPHLIQQQEPQSSTINYQTITKHLVLPHIISGYVQLFLNLLVVCIFLVLGYLFVITIRQDVGDKMDKYSQDILQEIALCSRHYIENKCSPSERIPAMQQTCLMWETCMSRDPRTVGTVRVSAETIAEIVNSLLEPISYKTIAVFSLFILGFIIISNIAFRLTSRNINNVFPIPPQNTNTQSAPSLPYAPSTPSNLHLTYTTPCTPTHSHSHIPSSQSNYPNENYPKTPSK